ncbi:AarF/ABC1/UbiB kinase family protein [Pontibacter sp. G13]|uniref:ABC1 kinase family protein n=1 Tax=Pontibacter sp. G13 TaxID=3074898 RepID=UPI002889F70E|nr:AarF/ABC1/UbiB kinase family protein [Pontibacter sp. G13]WNJ16663.1 AarF/ABC1/UbiB kinase family protein [Pontibacter sp. G13]
MKTGLKVGGNFVKHYSKKLIHPEMDRSSLDQQNAEEIYETLSELKGSALKVAQMLSMDKGVLPMAYSKKFAQAQYQAPALSGPLVVKTFQQYFSKSPAELYDTFDMKAKHAASIGQVHQATKDGKSLAVKIQYPGVADSVISDLKMIKPMAKQLLGFKERDTKQYFQEIQDRLLEETDYELELKRSMFISEACKDIPNLDFATYYPDLSCERIITMDWKDGVHLDDLLDKNPPQHIRNSIGQALWDFYNFQIHQLKIMHADAHPGNYLLRMDGTVCILDFGCVKEIPESFYETYFQLLSPEILKDEVELRKSCEAAQLIRPNDPPELVEFYMSIVKEALGLVLKPFFVDEFDFGDDEFFDSIYAYAEQMGRNPAMRDSMSPRGDKDGIYMNRTYFGLYSILNKLKAKIHTQNYFPQDKLRPATM